MTNSVVAIFLNGGFQYDAGNVFMHMLADELDKSVQVFRIDLRQPEDKVIEAMNMAIQINSSCFIAYNAILAELKYGQDKSLYDGTNIPMLAWLVDHPLHHRTRLESAGSRVLVGCVDKNHVDLVGRITSKGLSSFFCPHFACITEDAAKAAQSETANNPLKVIFPGSLGAPAEKRIEAIISKNALSTELFYALTQAAERDAGFDIYETAIECLKGLSIRLSSVDLASFLVNMVLPIDGYIRAKRREDLLAAMREVGISVDIYGNAANNHPALEGHRYHGAIGFQELLKDIASSDVLLDSGANFSNGTHERVLTGIGLGKVVITPKNKLWSQYFTNFDTVKVYQPYESRAVAEWLVDLKTEKVKHGMSINEHAKQVVMDNFTVSHTAQTIIDMLSLGV